MLSQFLFLSLIGFPAFNCRALSDICPTFVPFALFGLFAYLSEAVNNGKRRAHPMGLGISPHRLPNFRKLVSLRLLEFEGNMGLFDSFISQERAHGLEWASWL
ncbi:uncharacterized protein BO72DRAFT_452089 [Aspergillus fijiensis CBS 313.89]|uniref:Uncharacterized protein n=1 Tax=Aspergillus fijiensis CBS 313.89 TaxID=1448319 RepID=A0A8G1RFS4_9EURO|nr:uncharacterized protein BO72DRAFT_452089 [Aspergillus fijiensis CBS 313.89]RAK72997.1 hypothetical protein BO72DRAFT_452089 [Aspergillus fijiensis CBS 313.89]